VCIFADFGNNTPTPLLTHNGNTFQYSKKQNSVGDQQRLLHLYRCIIRWKLDYGYIVYGSTRNSYLSMLEPIQYCALRLCLGASRASPACSLCLEANEPPLYIYIHLYSPNKVAMYINEQINKQKMSTSKKETITCNRPIHCMTNEYLYSPNKYGRRINSKNTIKTTQLQISQKTLEARFKFRHTFGP